MTYLKNFTKILAAVVAIFAFNNILNAQTIGGGTYMIGDFVEVGINNDRGMEGAPSLAGSNNRSNQPITSPVYFGFVANPQMDGWVNYDGDFFTPGSPENGFGLEIAGTNYSNNAASTFWNQIPGALTSYDEIGDCIIVTWEGSVAGVDIKITYKLVKTNIFYTTTVRLINTTAASMTDVYYYRNFDPDNNVTIGGGYATQNTVVAQPAPGCEKAYVTAEQTTPWDSYVGMGGLDANMRVTYGGFGNRDASNIWNGIGLTSAVASTTFSDQAISLAYKAATFPAGDTVEFTFAIVMDEASYDLAMSNLYSFNFEGASSTDECIPVVDTAWTCAGQPVTIDVIGPDVSGYSWSWSPGTDLSTTTGPTTDASPSTTTTYTVTGTPLACLSTPLLKDIVVDILPAPDVSIVDPGPQCDNFDLSTLVVNDLNAVPGTVTNFYSVIPDSSDQVAGLLPDLIMEPGDVVYVMIGVPPDGCFDYEPVTITWDTHPTAGLDNASSDCSGAGSIDLNAMLSGADAGGTWEETTSPLGGGLDAAGGTYDISTVSPGDYTIDYIVGSPLGACPNDTATMTLTVEEEVYAGLDNSTTICNSAGTTLDMNTLLSGADAGGTWSETSTTPSGSFDTPTGVLDASGLAGGTYTFDYTVPAVAPCLTDVATMTITINEEPNAGADNTTSICNSPGSFVDLDGLLSGADAGGTWAETTASGSFDPTTGVLTTGGLTAGTYSFTYTVTGVAPCPDDVANFTVTVEQEVYAGADNTTSICNTAGSSVDLNTLLSGADAGGTWAETTASGSFDAASGVLDTDGLTAGTYSFTYTVDGVAPCPDDVADFTVTVEQEVNAGADNSTSICNTAGSSVDLDDLLSADADAGGTWAETSASGAFDPASGVLDTDGLAAGTYTFTYTMTAVAPCVDDVADFTVTVEQEVNAGLDNTTSICNTAGSSVDLNTLLSGADAGGSWTETTASGSFDAASGVLDTDGLAAGTYDFTYTVFGVAPCPNDVADFSVTVEQEVNAGADNSTSICNTAGSSVDLDDLLSADADAGGTWVETSASGAFDAATAVLNTDGLAAGTYTFTYTMTAVAPCPDDVADFTVTVEQEAIAGDDNTATLCNSAGSTIDLNTLLSADAAAGTWAETSASGAFDPATGVFDASGLTAADFTFTYTVTGVAPCPDDVADFTITVTDLPDAGLDNTTSICNTAGSSVDLNTLLSGADPGGTWSETTASGSFDAASGVLDTDGLTAGTYTFEYTLAAVGPCPGDVSTFDVTVEQEVNAGADNSTSICNTAGSSVDLDDLLSADADAGGTWAETSASGAFDPASGVLDTDGLAAGTYTFTYTMTAVAPCVDDVADFTVTVEQEVNAGLDNTTSICNTAGSSVDLNTLLSGADAGGSWTETTASGSFDAASGVLDTDGLAAGTYDFTYTVFGVAPCPNDVADFSVTVEQEVNAGADNSTSICNTAGSSVDLDDLLSADADAGGTWVETSASGAFDAATAVLNTDGLAAGTYTFTYTMTAVAPCPDDVADFTVTVEQEAIAGDDNTATLCNSAGSTIDLNTLLSADAAAGGLWSETTTPTSGSFTPASGVFDASGLTPGDYTFTYTIIGVAPCPNDVSDFTITVTDLPDAGADGSTSICNTAGSSVDVNTLLSGADAGGTWSETTASGSFDAASGILDTDGLTAGTYTFEYTLAAVGPCPGDVSTFDVTVEQEVNAGDDNSTSICNTAGSSVDLDDLLSADADAGGTWAETSASGAFDPATAVLNTDGLAAGTYTFTYTMTAVAPCVDDVSNFTVTVEQEVNAGADNVTQTCNYPGASVNLNTLLSGADAGGTWVESTSSGAFTPSTAVLNADGLAAGTYDFTYTVDGVAPCADDDASFTVTVDQVPSIDPLTDEEMCDGDSHTAQVFSSDVAGTTFDWTNATGTDIGFGLAGTGNIGGYTGTSGSSADVTVTIDVVPTSPAGCVGETESFDVVVHPLPVVSFEADTLIGCEPLQVGFTNYSSGGVNCTWDFGNGATATGCTAVSNTYDYAGEYDVTLTVETIYGCVNSDTYESYISVSPNARAEFTYNPTEIFIDDPTVEFTNHSDNADGYTWNFGDGSATSTTENPEHTFPEVGDVSYTVTLIAESNAGCPDTAKQIIKVEDVILFFIPNSFTPDGDDYNDNFTPIITAGVDIYDYHFTIFNRWGEIVFESYNPAYGWDGTYGGRGLVEDGAYIWQLEFGETMSDKKHKHRGHVTILK